MAITEAVENEDEAEQVAEAQPDPLADEVSELIAMLRHEIGMRWMSLPLQLQIEEVEILLHERGTMPTNY